MNLFGLLLILTFGNAIQCSAQNEDVLDNFAGTEFNRNILLNWSITEGNTCNGIDILHSTDSINFTFIGDIEGICGSTSETIYYDFTHTDVDENTTHYYKLQLGSSGFSWIISIDVFDFDQREYRLGPNPLGTESMLVIENSNHVKMTLHIYDLNGGHLQTETTSNSFFLLEERNYRNGKYLFTISKEGDPDLIHGDFIVD